MLRRIILILIQKKWTDVILSVVSKTYIASEKVNWCVKNGIIKYIDTEHA